MASAHQVSPANVDSDSVLRFEHVTVRFGEHTALNNVSFDVHRGHTCIILGEAGSGKSVLLKAAIGLVEVASGNVHIFDAQTTNLPEEEMYPVRSRVGIAFQESALFDSMTIAQNVAYPLLNQPSIRLKPDEARKRVKDALEFVELGGTLAKYPSELSGGMRRRAAIARAVVTQPPLLLYDSPTAGLDPITAHTIMALIVKERDMEETTALVVTHRYQDGNLVANFRYNSQNGSLEPSHLSDTTQFMVMREGQLVFEGDQDELEASKDSYVSKFVKHPN